MTLAHLIVGAPGSGKTTLISNLYNDLKQRATQYPIGLVIMDAGPQNIDGMRLQGSLPMQAPQLNCIHCDGPGAYTKAIQKLSSCQEIFVESSGFTGPSTSLSAAQDAGVDIGHVVQVINPFQHYGQDLSHATVIAYTHADQLTDHQISTVLQMPKARLIDDRPLTWDQLVGQAPQYTTRLLDRTQTSHEHHGMRRGYDVKNPYISVQHLSEILEQINQMPIDRFKGMIRTGPHSVLQIDQTTIQHKSYNIAHNGVVVAIAQQPFDKQHLDAIVAPLVQAGTIPAPLPVGSSHQQFVDQIHRYLEHKDWQEGEQVPVVFKNIDAALEVARQAYHEHNDNQLLCDTYDTWVDMRVRALRNLMHTDQTDAVYVGSIIGAELRYIASTSTQHLSDQAKRTISDNDIFEYFFRYWGPQEEKRLDQSSDPIQYREFLDAMTKTPIQCISK